MPSAAICVPLRSSAVPIQNTGFEQTINTGKAGAESSQPEEAPGRCDSPAAGKPFSVAPPAPAASSVPRSEQSSAAPRIPASRFGAFRNQGNFLFCGGFPQTLLRQQVNIKQRG